MQTQSFHLQTPLFQGFPLPKWKKVCSGGSGAGNTYNWSTLSNAQKKSILDNYILSAQNGDYECLNSWIQIFINSTGQSFGQRVDAQYAGNKKFNLANADVQELIGHVKNRLELSELYIYGSGRLGQMEPNLTLAADAERSFVYNPFTGAEIDPSTSVVPPVYTTSATHKSFIIGQKRYEISNHLGNVSSVITDRKFGVSTSGSAISYYLADIVTATDYDPYGQALPGRVWNRTGYRFGFNGQEFDSELGEVWSAEFWEYDASLGRRWDIDPIDYAWQSPYVAFDGNPIAFSDPLGLAAQKEGDGDGKDANGNVTKGNDPKVTKKDIRGLKKLEKAIKKLRTFEGTPNATSGGVEIHGGKRGSNHSIWKNRLRTGQPAVLDDDRIDYKLWYKRWQYNRGETNKYQFQPSAGDVFSTLATAAAVYFTLETMGLGPAAVELLLDQTGIPNPKDVVNIVKGLFRLGKTGFNFARKWLGQWELDRVATFKNLSCNIPILKFRKIKYKAFGKDKLKEHFDKHGKEFGDITQPEYLKRAKEFASEESDEFLDEAVGNIYIKYDPKTRRVFIGNAKDKEIRSFYIAGEDVENPLQEAIDTATKKTTK